MIYYCLIIYITFSNDHGKTETSGRRTLNPPGWWMHSQAEVNFKMWSGDWLFYLANFTYIAGPGADRSSKTESHPADQSTDHDALCGLAGGQSAQPG